MDFVIGGSSGACAGIFTNPFEVIKTRQQLQGELQKNGQSSKVPYRGMWQSVKSVVKSDGIIGLQKGLGPALVFQFAMNGVRLGMFETVDNTLHWTRRHKNETRSPTLCIFWGAVCGGLSSMVSSPFYLIKVQIQSQTSGQYAVGYQHHHKGTIDGLRMIYNQYGIKGLWKGCMTITQRTTVGSAAQLSSFTYLKDFFLQYEIFQNSTFLTASSASIFSGLFVCVFMQPFDVATTRVFNQGTAPNGKGLLYNGMTDCFVKTFRIEGIRGLYKGFFANYCRLAPHTILNLTFWDLFKKARHSYRTNEDVKFLN